MSDFWGSPRDTEKHWVLSFRVFIAFPHDLFWVCSLLLLCKYLQYAVSVCRSGAFMHNWSVILLWRNLQKLLTWATHVWQMSWDTLLLMSLPFPKSFQSYYLSDIKYGHRQQHSASVRQLSAVVMPYPTPKIRGGISWMNCYGNTRTNSKV